MEQDQDVSRKLALLWEFRAARSELEIALFVMSKLKNSPFNNVSKVAGNACVDIFELLHPDPDQPTINYGLGSSRYDENTGA